MDEDDDYRSWLDTFGGIAVVTYVMLTLVAFAIGVALLAFRSMGPFLAD